MIPLISCGVCGIYGIIGIDEPPLIPLIPLILKYGCSEINGIYEQNVHK